MTVKTTAFAAYLDCKIIDPSAYLVTLTDGSDDIGHGRGLSVVAIDRDCSVNATNLVFRSFETYITPYYELFCNNDDSYRFSLLSYKCTPESVLALSNLSMISCILEY